MLKFEDCCEKAENIPSDLLKITNLFKDWRDFIFDIYNELLHENRTTNNIVNDGLVNPVIGCLIFEIVTTLDGLHVLAAKNSFESIPVLTRKFLEITTQIIFILKDDSYTKALVYELKEISFLSQQTRSDCLSSLKQILNNDYKVDDYNKTINNLIKNNKYYDWYKIYDIQLNSFQKLYECIDTNSQYPSSKDIWQKMYGPLSRTSHGFIAGKNIIAIGSSNVLNSYRFPYDISFSVLVVQFMGENLINSLNAYYNVLNKAKIELFFHKQKTLYLQIVDAEQLFYANTKRKLKSIDRERKRAIKKVEKHKLKNKIN